MKRVGFFEFVLVYGKLKCLSCSTLRSCRTVFTLPQKLRKREDLHAFWLHHLWYKRGGGGLDVYEQNWSHRIKFFTNLSKVCLPSAIFQELLCHGFFPTGCNPSGVDCSQHSHRQELLPEKLLLYGSLQRAAVPARNSSVGSPRTAASFRVCPSAAVWSISSPFSLNLMSAELFTLRFFWLKQLLCSNLYTFLNILSVKYHWSGWWAQLWPVVFYFGVS